jgi:hypothetical protein
MIGEANEQDILMFSIFFITDCIMSNEAPVEDCPNINMVGDNFTKLLQGELFRKCCDFVMNIHP